MRSHALMTPWAITPEGLRLVLAVATRGDLFADVLAARRADIEDGDGPGMQGGRHPMAIEDGVAVVKVLGPLCRHADALSDISGATGYGAIRRQMQAAMADDQVRAVLLKIDSPGGEANGVAALAEQIRGWSKDKPVVAYVEGYGASAAYWLASAAVRILCASTAFLGSIGVRAAVVDDSAADEAEGRKEIEIVSSQSPAKRGKPVDDEVLARVQRQVDDLASAFVGAVAAYRGVSEDAVLSDFGQGDVMIGPRAVRAGLADEISDYDAALKAARSLGQAKAPQMKAVTPPRRTRMQTQTLAERLRAMAADPSQATPEALTSCAEAVAKQSEELIAAKSEIVKLGTRAEAADYEALIKASMADDGNEHARKIISPAQEARVRQHFPSLEGLKGYLATAEQAPKLRIPQPKDDGDGSAIQEGQLRSRILSSMGYGSDGGAQ